MKKIITKAAFLCIALSFTCTGNAQQKQPEKARTFGKNVINEAKPCGATEYEALLQQKNPKRATTEEFEQWMAAKTAERLAGFTTKSTNQVVTIPVVVHVIHNGNSVGVDENLSLEQIQSQITILNQDFRRQEGTNGFNTNPVGADVEVEFCLAQRDPNGLLSDGVDRIAIPNYSPFGWDLAEAEAIKAQTQWDPEKYLNIWTFDMVTTMLAYEIYGYSQFPTASTLDGLTDPSMSTEADTDGIIVKAGCFGSSDIYPEGYYNTAGRDKGRTLSHEVGHFLGLRHIWGDLNNCTADDYCADTPISFTANQGPCPGEGFDSCPESPGTDMYENYMDYTNDVCLNVFTLDQKNRIRTVLENSPRRVGLLTANSCMPGNVLNNDGSLNFHINSCDVSSSPKIILTNSGSNAITSAVISYQIDNQEAVQTEWTGNLASGEEAIIALTELNLSNGNHTINHSIVSVNGITDEAPTNDTLSKTFSFDNYTTTQVIVNIKTDNAASQTLWVLLDSNGDEVFSYDGGTYQNNQLYTETIAIDNSDCYTFLIVDTGANGLCCNNGNGYYEVKTADGTLIAQGSEFEVLEQHTFGINAVLDRKEVNALDNIKLYPNPANNIINITMPENESLPENYSVYNSLGQLIGTEKITSANTSINISNYADGIYFIKINKGNAATTLRFVKY